jgi:hypothetical protein
LLLGKENSRRSSDYQTVAESLKSQLDSPVDGENSLCKSLTIRGKLDLNLLNASALLCFRPCRAAAVANTDAQAPTGAMNAVAERYAHLMLALGQHDPDYVDAFYGPAEWKTQAGKEKKSLDAIGAEAAELIATLAINGLDFLS